MGKITELEDQTSWQSASLTATTFLQGIYIGDKNSQTSVFTDSVILNQETTHYFYFTGKTFFERMSF